ncbi:GNAT family N-acetyltransferase [Reichenbachiella sp.]|uniref:GNAT family N-acetyltransferase n=1 Tax=Reichenbachiella sp. TaxID=2184521 RepID=UPI003BAE5E46
MHIRSANNSDIEFIIHLCAEHAAFEKVGFNQLDKKQALIDLFFIEEALKCLVVEQENVLVGYATFMRQISTWDAGYYIYLDCLYLKENIRGQGVGHQLMNRIKSFAREENCNTIQWQTPNFNEQAIEFYNRIGATSKTKERFFLECLTPSFLRIRSGVFLR